jgi:purine-binding chemotaxis protein CheW
MSKEFAEATADQFEQLVVFQLANEYYGASIGEVNTIIRMQEVTEVPRTPDFVEGVINLRGSIIPVIDLRKRFGLPVGDITKSSRIVVVEALQQLIGMIVDAVAETLHMPCNAIEPPSAVISSSLDSEYLRGIGKQDDRLVILLDLDKVISIKDLDAINKAEKQARKEKQEPVSEAA